MKMNLVLKEPVKATEEFAEMMVLWRRNCPESLRTPYPITKEMQLEYLRDVVTNRKSDRRIYFFYRYGENDVPAVGVGGLQNIEWENGRAEISLLVAPDERGKGSGKQCVEDILDVAFNDLRLLSVWGECYWCSPALGFWQKLAEEKKWLTTMLPMTKMWRGKIYPSFHFTVLAPGVKHERPVVQQTGN